MTHQQLREMLPLAIYDELNDSERLAMSDHLAGCPKCREEFEELKRLHGAMQDVRRPEPAPLMLAEARRNLRAVLAYAQTRRSWYERLTDFMSSFRIPAPAVRWGAVSLVLFLAGYGVGKYGLSDEQSVVSMGQTEIIQADMLEQGGVDITNVRFVDSDPSDGEIEFTFNAVRPVQIKGTLDDPMIQKVLSHAMVNEQNPGVRLRAVNALTSSSSPENDIKRALIITLKTDANSGVRREAFTALVKYPYDESIKDALLHVLNHDDNPGLRIEAINLLETQTQSRTQVDREMMDVLRSRIEMDDNPYIRTRARTVLEEFSNP